LAKKSSKTTDLVPARITAPALEVIRLKYEFWISVAKSMIWAGTFGFCAWCARDVALAYAGKSTELVAVIQATMKMNLNEYAAWFLAGLGVLYGGRAHYTLRRLVRDHGQKFRDYELLIDPKRSSSGLPRTGTPRKKDREQL
jgi:hypothetical protein